MGAIGEIGEKREGGFFGTGIDGLGFRDTGDGLAEGFQAELNGIRLAFCAGGADADLFCLGGGGGAGNGGGDRIEVEAARESAAGGRPGVRTGAASGGEGEGDGAARRERGGWGGGDVEGGALRAFRLEIGVGR